MLVFVVFAAQLVRVQGFAASGYAERAIDELTRSATLHAQRGAITDVDGVVLARSVDTVDITVDQTMILDPQGTAALLAPILDMRVGEIRARITGTRRFAYVAKGITPQAWDRVANAIDTANRTRAKDQRIFGLFPQRSFKRLYPAGDLGASVLGYVNAAGQGAAGVEYAFNSKLAGADGKYVYTSGGGPVIPNARDVLTPAQNGADLHLTIKRDIQWMAQQAIAKQVKRSRADWGTVIVMDPATGNVLAMATAPSFDPSASRSSDLQGLRPYAVSDVYEPGSTGKVMTVAAALEEGTVTPTSVFSVPWKMIRNGHVFHDHERHPLQKLTTAGVLAISSNTGTIKIGETLRPETLRDYLVRFGVGEKTGIGLSGESGGLLQALPSWSGTTFPAVSFGQSYSVTAVQATNIFATIANGGLRVQPTLVAGFTDGEGNYLPTMAKDPVRVISPETASKVRLMMESVVSASGTAPAARIPGYRVAGKTGTAQRFDPECNCYRGYVSSFIGFVPADQPRLVINVTINNPRGLYYGSLVAAPIFRQVGEFALKALAIPPTGAVVKPYPLDAAALQRQVA
jgi:cell division protein FtsI (penicillin-binding protein 3)